MADTTEHGIPYPEGSDLLISGDNALRSLAEHLDVYAEINGFESNIPYPSTTVGWDGTINLSPEFELTAADTLTYTGPRRFFAVSVRTSWGDVSGVRAVSLTYDGPFGSISLGSYTLVNNNQDLGSVIVLDSGDSMTVALAHDESSGPPPFVSANVWLIVAAL